MHRVELFFSTKYVPILFVIDCKKSSNGSSKSRNCKRRFNKEGQFKMDCLFCSKDLYEIEIKNVIIQLLFCSRFV
jgi:hypothetical protein